MTIGAQPFTPTKRIEICEPGVYADSNCLFVVTTDITNKGKGLRFEGKNYVVDLNGNTLTFNTEPYESPDPKEYHLYKPAFGVMLLGENAELRNGHIIQGKGRSKAARCIYIGCKGGRIHDTVTVITGGDMGKNVFAQWGGFNIELDHNYMVNNADAESDWYGAITLTYAGDNWDIHHNTIVGGHQGILVGGLRAKENVHVHHNYISHKRSRGQKAPEAIYIFASGCEIDNNEIVTIDGRGIEPVGGNNCWHHNIVDVRYTSKADRGFYPENRCYGFWARDRLCGGNRISDNLFVVGNEVLGDESSNSIGMMLCTSPGLPQLNAVVITGNRLFVRHSDKVRSAWGLSLTNVGDQVVFKNNYVWADTAAVVVDDRSKGAIIENNTFVKANNKWKEISSAHQTKDEGARHCLFRGNIIVPPPTATAAPAAPMTPAITRRINGFELHWPASREADVLGYYVYRDGKKVENRLKCTHFYVDVSADPAGRYTYSLSAVNTAGIEGPGCEAVSTETPK